MDYNKLDEAVYSIYCYLYSLSKEQEEIELKNFDRKDPNHLTLFYISSMVKKIFGYQIFIDCNLINYVFMKIKFNYLTNFKRRKSTRVLNCNDIVYKIEHLYYKGILKDIYEAYYEHK